jgi:hypothetical protein
MKQPHSFRIYLHKEGKVPWNNLSTDTHRFMAGVAQELSIKRNSFTMVLISITSIISKQVNESL